MRSRYNVYYYISCILLHSLVTDQRVYYCYYDSSGSCVLIDTCIHCIRLRINSMKIINNKDLIIQILCCYKKKKYSQSSNGSLRNSVDLWNMRIYCYNIGNPCVYYIMLASMV